MKFNYSKIFLLGIGYFAISVAWATYNAFVPIFLASKFHLEPALIGFFMALDNIAALLVQPPVGVWSDHVQTPIGRRLPFILVGAPVGAVVFGFTPLITIFPLFVACTLSFILSMAFWRTPFFALMPDITPSEYRSQANGILNFMGGAGAILAFLGGSALYRLNSAYPFWMGSAISILAVAFLLIFIREPLFAVAKSKGQASPPRNLLNGFEMSDKSALYILLAILLVFVSNNAFDAFFSLYAVNHLGMIAADGARLMGYFTLIFVIFSIPSGFIGSHMGRRNSISTGIAIMIVSGLAQYLLPAQILASRVTWLPILGTLPVIGFSLMLSGTGWALVHANTFPMVTDMTIPARVGTYTGLYHLFSTFGAIIGPVMNGWIIQLGGNDYGLVMLVGPFFLLLALGMMLGVHRGEAAVQIHPI